jgi:hypothetical protein
LVGFRQRRGTQDAVHIVRRLLEQGESTDAKLSLVLLDWEKAFDKITRPGLFSALRRMRAPAKLCSVIEALYDNPRFQVEIDGVSSQWYTQDTGIRQGCPLSPYLFVIFMTVLMFDVNQSVRRNLAQHRPPGSNFDEVLFADDTICISSDTRSMNMLLAAIQREGAKYDMKLNQTKCEALVFGGRAAIKFEDGTPVKQVSEAKYLGCFLNTHADAGRELRARMRAAIITMQRMHTFWRHSNCSVGFKCQVLRAVLFTKILFGLESAALTQSQQRSLERAPEES